jgi:hypothetical protein
MGERQMFPVHTKITRKGSGDVTVPFCPPRLLLHRDRFADAVHRTFPSARGTGAGSDIVSGMYDIAIAEAWASEQLWALYAAIGAVDDAIAALEEAGAGLLPLIADSEWASDGVRALHELLNDIKDRSASEIAQLGDRIWELEAIGR